MPPDLFLGVPISTGSKDATLLDLPRSLFRSPSDIVSPRAHENVKPPAVRSHFSSGTLILYSPVH